jgi:hypothetical protein
MDIPRFYPGFPRSFSGEKALLAVCFVDFPQTVLKTGWKVLKTADFFNTKQLRIIKALPLGRAGIAQR